MMSAAAAELMQVHALRPLPDPVPGQTGATTAYRLPMPKATDADDPNL